MRNALHANIKTGTVAGSVCLVSHVFLYLLKLAALSPLTLKKDWALSLACTAQLKVFPMFLSGFSGTDRTKR